MSLIFLVQPQQLDFAVYNALVRVTSTAFLVGGTIPIKNTCDGIDVSPPLRWNDVPEGTKSFALAVTDPDAPMEWIHWLVCDIPAEARLIPEGGPRFPPEPNRSETITEKKPMAGPAPPVENITITSRSTHWIRTNYWPGRKTSSNCAESTWSKRRSSSACTGAAPTARSDSPPCPRFSHLIVNEAVETVVDTRRARAPACGSGAPALRVAP